MPGMVEIVGDRTGQRWQWHLVRDRLPDTNGDRYQANSGQHTQALVYSVPKEDLWAEDLFACPLSDRCCRPTRHRDLCRDAIVDRRRRS